jgi:hypothetical protein
MKLVKPAPSVLGWMRTRVGFDNLAQKRQQRVDVKRLRQH